MDKRLLKQFTWGFEIEGLFKYSLLNKLKRLKNLDVEVKRDGSVKGLLLEGEEWEIKNREVAIGIFKNFEKMIKVLSLFKENKNYLQNETCGLHIHLGVKNKLLRARIGDYEFIKKLEKWVKKNLCERVKERLNNSYCKAYTIFNTTYELWREKAKYVFIGNHPQGTFEFRFFAPCRHKVDNVRRFFEFFFVELKKNSTIKEKKILLSVKKENFLINENIKMSESFKKFEICV